MSFYKNLKNKEDTDYDKDDDQIEEQYQKMFKKIARDFATIQDVKEFAQDLASGYSISNAIEIARIYKKNLNKSVDKREKYKDIEDIDWIYGVDENER